jgi:hypothetical protein
MTRVGLSLSQPGGKLNVIDIDLGLEDSVAAVIRADENGATVAALEVKLGLNDRH